MNISVLANIDGIKTPIPFNLNSIYDIFLNNLARELEKKLIYNFEYGKRIPILELKKNKDKDLQFLSDFIYEKLFLNYTIKQWGLKPKGIDRFVSARVPILISRDDRYFGDKYQVVPKNSYTKLFENILKHKNIKIMLNTNFKEILRVTNKGFKLVDNKFNSKVIYTAKIDELFDYKFG